MRERRSRTNQCKRKEERKDVRKRGDKLDVIEKKERISKMRKWRDNKEGK